MDIAIVCFNYGFYSGSLTSSLPNVLADKGINVDLFLDKISSNYCPEDDLKSGVRRLIFSSSRPERSYKSFLRSFSFIDFFMHHTSLDKRCMQVDPELHDKALWLQVKMTKNYAFIIAIEIRSLAALYLKKDKNIIYLNMELLSWDLHTWTFPHKYLLKTIERDMLNHVKRVLVTGPTRKHVFSEMNKYPLNKIDVLPVVPSGRETVESNNFFRNKFSISQNTKIVLYAGHFVKWAQLHLVIEDMKNWPTNTALVLHTWNKQLVNKDYLKLLYSLAKNYPVYFSFENLKKERICENWASADIGIAFYEPIDKNFTEILFSSNKFGEYMKAGLPVVCSPYQSLKEFVEKYKIGICVDPHSTSLAIRDIISNYDNYKNSVIECHKKYFILEDYLQIFDKFLLDF